MQITFHGKFAQDYGRVHHIEAKSVAEAIEGLTRQIGFYNDRLIEDRPVACVVGHDTIESLAECPDEIHIVPSVYGGGGVGKIVLGAALIAIAVINPAVGGMILSTLGQSIVAGIGVSLFMSGISQMFIKAPSLSRDGDPEASKYLGLSNNTTKLGTLRSYSMGRIKASAPHLLALNVDANEMVRGEFPV